MQRLNIKSFNNGVLEWTALGADGYLLEVNGERVVDGDDGLFRAETFDLSACGGVASVKITAVRDGKLSSAVSLIADAKNASLKLPKVSAAVKDGVLYWETVAGAAGYRLVDVKRNVITVTGNKYDMTYRNAVLFISAVSQSRQVSDGDRISPRYLSGKGTETEPYIINTPFDLRAVDCYESLYFTKSKSERDCPRNHYIIASDLDYNSVAALEGESNLFTLSAPFFGVLDGKGKTLSHISVGYDGGYWALFDFIARGAVVKNISFKDVEIFNRLQSAYRPLDASIATVAHVNYGTIENIVVSDMKYTAAGGAVCGICSHNSGLIRSCTVSGTLAQGATGMTGQACYEMAGIATENRAGGVLEFNAALNLFVRGTLVPSEGGVHYCTVRNVGGIAAVNRAGGCMNDNMFLRVTLQSVERTGEYGGLCAYNAGLISLGNPDNFGRIERGGELSKALIGGDEEFFGKAVGKNDGSYLTVVVDKKTNREYYFDEAGNLKTVKGARNV